MRVSDIISAFEIYSFWMPITHFNNGAYAHDVMAAILVFQNNEVAAMLMYQTNPVGVHMNVVPRSTMNTNGETEN